MNNKKETTAQFSCEVLCDCPHCGEILDILDDVGELLRSDHTAEGIEVEITCSNCQEDFIVTEVCF